MSFAFPGCLDGKEARLFDLLAVFFWPTEPLGLPLMTTAGREDGRSPCEALSSGVCCESGWVLGRQRLPVARWRGGWLWLVLRFTLLTGVGSITWEAEVFKREARAVRPRCEEFWVAAALPEEIIKFWEKKADRSSVDEVSLFYCSSCSRVAWNAFSETVNISSQTLNVSKILLWAYHLKMYVILPQEAIPMEDWYFDKGCQKSFQFDWVVSSKLGRSKQICKYFQGSSLWRRPKLYLLLREHLDPWQQPIKNVLNH